MHVVCWDVHVSLSLSLSLSLITYHLSLITYHLSFITYHLSLNITYHWSLITWLVEKKNAFESGKKKNAFSLVKNFENLWGPVKWTFLDHACSISCNSWWKDYVLSCSFTCTMWLGSKLRLSKNKIFLKFSAKITLFSSFGKSGSELAQLRKHHHFHFFVALITFSRSLKAVQAGKNSEKFQKWLFHRFSDFRISVEFFWISTKNPFPAPKSNPYP